VFLKISYHNLDSQIISSNININNNTNNDEKDYDGLFLIISFSIVNCKIVFLFFHHILDSDLEKQFVSQSGSYAKVETKVPESFDLNEIRTISLSEYVTQGQQILFSEGEKETKIMKKKHISQHSPQYCSDIRGKS
jgi:hypothetical protein